MIHLFTVFFLEFQYKDKLLSYKKVKKTAFVLKSGKKFVDFEDFLGKPTQPQLKLLDLFLVAYQYCSSTRSFVIIIKH